MIKATKSDESLVIRILSKSFKSNKSVGYTVGNGSNHLDRRRKLMAYSFSTCLDFGEVWISECKSCCVLILYPQLKRMTMKVILRDIDLAFSVVGLRLFKVLRRERLIRDCYKINEAEVYLKRENAIYLWFIGTSPAVQGQGKGTAMLNEILEKARIENKSVYLETSVESNLEWYKGFGFKVYDQIDLGYPLYFLNK